LASVLRSIKQQTGYVFISGDLDLNQEQVDVKVKNVPIDQALDACLKDLPLEYKIVDKTVVISLKEPTVLDRIKSALSITEVQVTGKITDEKGKPLFGVTILNKKTKKGTVSQIDGSYSIAADKGDALVFSFIGYKTKQIIVGDQAVINISLEQSTSNLDEVIVIGYGTSKKKDLTGSVSTVNAKDIENVPLQLLITHLLVRLRGCRLQNLTVHQAVRYVSGFGVQAHFWVVMILYMLLMVFLCR